MEIGTEWMPYILPQKKTNLSVIILDLYVILIMLILLTYPKQDTKRMILEIYLLAGSPRTI